LSHITIQPAWVSVTHGINALAVVLVMTSGWQVYDASPIFPLSRFPAAITLGNWLGGSLLWHFACMWILAVNFLVYLGLNVTSGRLRRTLLFVADLVSAPHGALGHDDLTRYNAVQKFAYLIVIVDRALLVPSGRRCGSQCSFRCCARQSTRRAFCGDERAGRVLCRARRDGRACAALAAFDDSRAVEMIFRQPTPKPDTYFSVHAASIIKDARNELKDPVRRLLRKRILTLGGLAMLSGSDLTSDKSVNTMLRRVAFFNDDVQALLFDPDKRAPTYPESMITQPFPFNAFYDVDDVLEVDASAYRFQVGGLANGKRTWTLDELRALPQGSRTTHHICIEGWSAIGRWGGALRQLAEACRRRHNRKIRVAALRGQVLEEHRHVHQVACADAAYRHVRRAIAAAKIRFSDQGAHADQARIKNPKHIVAITVTNEHPGGYWEARATTGSAVPDGITMLLTRQDLQGAPCLSA
jgi:DMSO/TMAO reductase YedYZ molybdopterin-dependent catalytic subunit